MTSIRDHSTISVPIVKASKSVDSVLEGLPGSQFDSVNSVFIADENEKLIAVSST